MISTWTLVYAEGTSQAGMPALQFGAAREIVLTRGNRHEEKMHVTDVIRNDGFYAGWMCQ